MMSLRNSLTPYNKRARTMVFSGTSFDCATVWKADTIRVNTLAATTDIVTFVVVRAEIGDLAVISL